MSQNKNGGGAAARETFGSRIGFLLVSAGCAVGIGNVWKFPYLCGQNGGAAFILIYLPFLVILGIPVLTCEFAIGRASGHSAAKAFEILAPGEPRWARFKWISIIGCYMLMMYYTTVCGWMLSYCHKHVTGVFTGMNADEVAGVFGTMLGSAGEMSFWMILACLIGLGVCYLGVRNGVERVSKYMMTALFVLMVVLAINSVTLKGAGSGIRFYLVPDFGAIARMGLGNVVFSAMSQAFFTLSIGISSMMIFGSYLNRERTLGGEAVSVTGLDTMVALLAGFIIIPACFAFGIEPGAGPSLIFITIPNLFVQMPGGRFWGALFFLFMSFAALSTVIAVFENIIAFGIDLFGWSRKKSVLINTFLLIGLSLPCVFGYNIWSGIALLGEGSTVLDFEDFIVSSNLLPLGSLAFILFCTRSNGWGFDAFLEEANAGKGLKLARGLRFYLTWILPLIIIAIYLKGYWDLFSGKGLVTTVIWFAVALVFLLFILITGLKPGKKR